MNFWQWLLKRGIFFSWSGHWRDDKNLPDWKIPDKVTKKEVENEIRDSLKKRR